MTTGLGSGEELVLRPSLPNRIFLWSLAVFGILFGLAGFAVEDGGAGATVSMAGGGALFAIICWGAATSKVSASRARLRYRNFLVREVPVNAIRCVTIGQGSGWGPRATLWIERTGSKSLRLTAVQRYAWSGAPERLVEDARRLAAALGVELSLPRD